jgi:hypothetical protein
MRWTTMEDSTSQCHFSFDSSFTFVSRLSFHTMAPARTGGRAPKATDSKSRRSSRSAGSDQTSVVAAVQKGKSPALPSDETQGPAVPAQDDQALCFICAEPVRYWSLGPCSHRTCHVCAIRLRALYKKNECTFCKVGLSPEH